MRYVYVFLVLLLTIAPKSGEAAAIAATDQFTAQNNLPVSARTTFYEPLWSNSDETGTAQHELLHAVGYAIAYGRFAQHVDSSRNFRKNRPASGTILAKLVAAGSGTHIDPAAGVVNGHDQSRGLMQPTDGTGRRMGGQDKSVLDAPFWSSLKLKITMVYLGNWTATQKSHIEAAKSAAEALYSNGSSSHTFTWTVRISQTGSLVMPTTDFNAILSGLRSTTSEGRAKALQTLFALNKSDAIEALLNAGARPMASITPPLENVALSILTRQAAIPFKTDAIGLHTSAGVDSAALSAMGERHGFVVPENVKYNPKVPNIVYVDIARGADLWTVIESVLSKEPRIENINLNFFEE